MKIRSCLKFNILTLFILALINCKNPRHKVVESFQFRNKVVRSYLINYKQNSCNLFLGQAKDSLDKIIDLTWDCNADNLATKQYTVQHYYYIGEPLIQIAKLDSAELLPALFFILRNDTLVDFRCSISYSSQNRSKETINSLLSVLTPYFDKLTTSSYNQLCENLVLQFDNTTVLERFSLDTSQIDQINFDYEIKTR